MPDIFQTITGGFFDSVNQDRLYNADQMNMPYKKIVSDGLFFEGGDGGNIFKVTAAGGMTVNVGPGNALIGGKWAENEDALSVEISGNTSESARVDSVILRLDANIETRAIGIVYRQGAAAAPALDTSDGIKEFRLANIAVAVNAVAITDVNITDTRGTADCPWVSSIVTPSEAQLTAGVGAYIQQNPTALIPAVEGSVAEWIEEHPEAITTVQDGSLTEAKFSNALKLKAINGYVTPEMYGAKGDGVTDDTAAIQDALDAGGWIVFKPGGVYKTTASLHVSGNTFIDLNGATITGTAHRLLYNFVDDDVFTGYNGNGNIRIRNGKISGGCITFWHGQNISFEDIKFSRCVCDHFIEIAACKGVLIQNCDFVGMAEQTYSAVYEYINIDPCTTEATTYFGGEAFAAGNYDGTKNRDIYIVGCYFNIDESDANYQFLDDAIGCHTPWGQHHDNINIIGNKILNFKKFAIRASDMQNSVIRDNYIESAVNTEYAIACYSKDPDTVPSVINLLIQSNIIKVAKNCISAMSTEYLSAVNNIYYPGDNANHAVVDLYGAIADHASIVGNKTNIGFTTAYSISGPHLSETVFEALQETPLTGISVSGDVMTSANIKFTEFSKFAFLFGYVSGGTFNMRTVQNWFNDKTFAAGKTFPIIVDDTTGAVLMSFEISSENENVLTITKASGVTFPTPRGVLVSK